MWFISFRPAVLPLWENRHRKVGTIWLKASRKSYQDGWPGPCLCWLEANACCHSRSRTAQSAVSYLNHWHTQEFSTFRSYVISSDASSRSGEKRSSGMFPMESLFGLSGHVGIERMCFHHTDKWWLMNYYLSGGSASVSWLICRVAGWYSQLIKSHNNLSTFPFARGTMVWKAVWPCSGRSNGKTATQSEHQLIRYLSDVMLIGTAWVAAYWCIKNVRA